jgi:hypothetical protein
MTHTIKIDDYSVKEFIMSVFADRIMQKVLYVFM